MDEPEVHPCVREVAADIDEMETRGASAIADAAARALAVQAEESDARDADALRAELRAAARTLHDTRPTAVSLPNALRYVLGDLDGGSAGAVRSNLIERAGEFRRRLDRARDDLGGIGAGRLRDGDRLMLHCHSTDALACVEAAVDAGRELSAIVKETRPRNQGKVTAGELRDLGVPVTYVVDNAAGRYLNDVDHVLVGADSIAADGSVVNKVGTSLLAIAARERGTPIMVAAQTIKLDPATLSGQAVEIEMRDESEVIGDAERREIGDIEVENPAFDVTPPRYVDAIVTERGQFPPESVVTLMRELFGERVGTPWTG